MLIGAASNLTPSLAVSVVYAKPTKASFERYLLIQDADLRTSMSQNCFRLLVLGRVGSKVSELLLIVGFFFNHQQAWQTTEVRTQDNTNGWLSKIMFMSIIFAWCSENPIDSCSANDMAFVENVFCLKTIF